MAGIFELTEENHTGSFNVPENSRGYHATPFPKRCWIHVEVSVFWFPAFYARTGAAESPTAKRGAAP